MASYLYTMEDIENTYANITHHISTRDIILRHSSNTTDIRAIAIDSLDLSHVKDVLDLGCGYGYFIEILSNRLHDDAQVTGIDIIDNQNREKFLFSVNSIGYEGEFVHGSADVINSMGDNTFDLVISSYSLYFFPHLVPHISRILSPGGIFISLTHSRDTLNEIVQMIPLSISDAGITPPLRMTIEELFSAFCVENGRKLLEPYFDKVEIIHYPNSLVFKDIHIDDCISYLDKKKHLLFKEIITSHSGMMRQVIDNFYYRIMNMTSIEQTLTLTKNDAIFRAYHSSGNGTAT